MTAMRSQAEIRGRFPALSGSGPLGHLSSTDWVFFENAGGSQVPIDTIMAMNAHMVGNYVQLGAGYPASNRATATVAQAHKVSDIFAGGGDGGVDGYSVLGSSTSALLGMLATCLSNILKNGDEVVVSSGSHMAHIDCWKRLCSASGASLIWWEPSAGPPASMSPLGSLQSLLTERTALVAVSHCSNILGEVVDVAAATAMVKAVNPSALVVVDGVALSPHRAVDVGSLGVDWYVWSCYKVFGPHAAALFGRRSCWKLLEGHGPNHQHVAFEDGAYFFERGNVPHELCAGIVGSHRYLRWLSGRDPDAEWEGDAAERMAVVEAMARCRELEKPLVARVLSYLESKASVSVLGLSAAASLDDDRRVPTISFTHATLSPRELVAASHAAKVAVRNGHMYSQHLVEVAGRIQTPPIASTAEEGVCRLSLVHYNTLEEVERWIAAMETVL